MSKIIKTVKPKTVSTVPKKIKKENAKPAASSSIEKLKGHASKHLSAWYTKAGDDKEEFAKHVAKYARDVAKQSKIIV